MFNFQFQDIFHLEGENVPPKNFYMQKLSVTDKTPVYVRNFRLPQSKTQEINNQAQELIDDDIVEPSISPYNSPLLIVPKKIR